MERLAQQTIGFVDDEKAEMLEGEARRGVQMVDKPAGGCDEDVHLARVLSLCMRRGLP